MRQIDLAPVACYMMKKGIGDFGNKSACVVAQAAILDALSRGIRLQTFTDNLDCACPVLRVLAITLNDGNWWSCDLERTETLRPLISALLDSRVDSFAIAKRALIASNFANYAAESAEYAAKYAVEAAKRAAESAESAAKRAAESAKRAAEYAVESAEFSAESAEYAAKYAVESAEYAAESAKRAAERAAESAEYAEFAAKRAAEYAESAEYAEFKRNLRDALLKAFWDCEAIR